MEYYKVQNHKEEDFKAFYNRAKYALNKYCDFTHVLHMLRKLKETGSVYFESEQGVIDIEFQRMIYIYNNN